MTSILRDWLISANIEWQRDRRLEDVFSNGYLIGKLLCNLEIGGLNQEIFESQFIDDVSIQVMTSNYKLITKYLCDGGINIKPKLLQDIANNIDGAIHRFIYDLKCFMDTKEKDIKSTLSPHQKTLTLKDFKDLNIGTSSFKSPPRISSPTRIRKYLYEDMQKRDVEEKVRKLATEQFHKRSELKWQKFRDHAIEIEEKAKIEAEFEKQLKNERISQRHDLLVKTLKTHHTEREDLAKSGKEKWIINQKIKQKRISEKLHFQQTQRMKQIQTINIKRKDTANQTAKCIDEFEDILIKTQKLQKDESQEIKASEKLQQESKNDTNAADKNEQDDIDYNDKSAVISKDDPLEHLEKLRRQLPDKTVSMQKTEKYMEQIKINVTKQKVEMEQRQQRRKQLIADQMAINQEKEKLDREQEINDIINDTSKATKKFDETIRNIKLHKKIFKQNASFIKQQENERKQKDETIKLNRDRQHFEIRKVEFKTKLTIQARKLKELKLKQEQHHHVENIKYCRKLVGCIIDITYKSVLYRKLSDQQEIPNSLRSEWMSLLSTENTHKSSESQHILTNIDEDAKNEQLSKPLTDILEKEKQCHTDIIQIQHGLMECMDINGTLNQSLINQTELDNYLNGKGIWSYTADKEEEEIIKEPSNDNLGSIIEEIISVSEGPDPRHQKIIPDVPISIAFIGKPFVGKSTQSQQIADKYALQIINPEQCIQAAIAAFDGFMSDNDGKEEKPEMNGQQEIGQRLKVVLEDGKEVDDELYIDAIFDAILSVKDEEKLNGWILDGFPIRRSHAELLEAKLTGFVDTPPPKKGKPSKKKKSKVAPPVKKDPADIPKIHSGLDFVFYLDVESGDVAGNDTEEQMDIHQVLLDRARGRLMDKTTGRVYHITENPPPHDQAIKEKLSSPPDEEYVASLPEHFKAFDERKDDLKTWFDKFGNWYPLNCNQDRMELTTTFIEMIKEKIQSKKEMEEKQQQNTEAEIANDAQEADKENVDNINIQPAENNDDGDDAENEAVDRETEEKSDAIKEPETMQIMPWDEPLKDQNMCRRLHYFWSNIEESYIDNITNTFELLRHERRRILAYLASTREYFYNFLRRTDGKQAMIDGFQTEFNTIHPDMRRDDDTKDELHQRTEELSFQLFEYSMKRKNESVEELNAIKNSIWLSTEKDALSKIVTAVVQYELNRYISTIRVTKDYFALKNDQSISEDSSEPIDLLTILEENTSSSNNKASNKGKKGKKGKDKKAAANDGDNDGNDITVLLEKLENAIDMALQYIIEPTPVDNNNKDDAEQSEQFAELQNVVIKDENERLKMRLSRLKVILSCYVKDVIDRHQNLMEKLDKWIGLRIDSENAAIDSLISHIQQAIEQEIELNYRLILEGENFLIDQDVIVCPMPNPIQKRPSSHQFTTKGVFTAIQIQQLIELLKSQNMNGVIEYSVIKEILQRLSNNAYAQSQPILPALWNNLNDEKLLEILTPFIIPFQSNQYVNWKLFVVSLMLQTLSVINNTVTVPSLDTLFDLKQALHGKDIKKTGKLKKKAFGQIALWFDETMNNVWHQILFDLFETANAGKEDEQKQDEVEQPVVEKKDEKVAEIQNENNAEQNEKDTENTENNEETENKDESIVEKSVEDVAEVKVEQEKKEMTEGMDYNQLLYHLCFNDQSHFGFEKVIALSQNANIIDNTKHVTNEELTMIQNRGIKEVEIVDFPPLANINEMKEDQRCIQFFKSIQNVTSTE